MEEEILEEIKKANEIVEIDENEEISNTQYDLEKVSNKKDKKPSKWSKLDKKTKITIIVSVILVILIVVCIVLYFTVFKNNDKENKYTEPMIVIEKDNYRYEDGKLVFIDENKNELGTYTCENKSEKLCYVANYSDEDDFDTEKKVYENGLAIDNRTDILENNYVFVYDNITKEDGNVILYDINKKKTIDTYNLVKEVKDNYVIVKKDNKYSLLHVMEDSVKEAFKDTYEYMGYIENTDNIVVSSNNNYSLIDFDGKDVSENVPGAIKTFDSNNISVKVGSNIYIYDYEGKQVIDDSFDYVRFVDTYVIALDGKKLYVFDKDGSSMTGDAIKITSNDYNTKLIFNEKLRQTGKEEAFNVTINDNTMKIE